MDDGRTEGMGWEEDLLNEWAEEQAAAAKLRWAHPVPGRRLLPNSLFPFRGGGGGCAAVVATSAALRGRCQQQQQEGRAGPVQPPSSQPAISPSFLPFPSAFPAPPTLLLLLMLMSPGPLSSHQQQRQPRLIVLHPHQQQIACCLSIPEPSAQGSASPLISTNQRHGGHSSQWGTWNCGWGDGRLLFSVLPVAADRLEMPDCPCFFLVHPAAFPCFFRCPRAAGLPSATSLLHNQNIHFFNLFISYPIFS